MSSAPQEAGARALWVVTVAAVAVALVAFAVGPERLRELPGRVLASASSWGAYEAFPDVDTAALTPQQAQLVEQLRTEFDEQPPGTKYSEGVEQAWCANFVSWNQRELGVPFENPHSGGWRIPGVYTLQEHLQATGRWHEPGSGFAPSTGDVLLYDSGGRFGRHVNYVVQIDGDTVTTVGGNENDRIGVTTFELSSKDNLLGYGDLTP